MRDNTGIYALHDQCSSVATAAATTNAATVEVRSSRRQTVERMSLTRGVDGIAIDTGIFGSTVSNDSIQRSSHRGI